ncbi:MAG: hypothetical protein A2Y62_12920, partial [Candidatus Fischerbacteria bacterium RBG_13_37_8]
MEILSEISLIYKQIYFFLVGAVIGSFLNVCIYRVPRSISIVFPASHCPHCRYEIPFYLNIPIIGWLLIMGKCRNCRAKISILYPLIEAISGINCMILYTNYGISIDLIFLACFTSMCIVLAFIDLEHYILPDVITIPMILLGLLYSLVSVHITFLDSLLGGLSGSFLLLFIYFVYLWLRKQEGMGMGDVKMIAGIGAFVGLKGMLLTLFLSVISGAIAGLFVMLRRSSFKLDIALPFGFFLGLVSLITIHYG